MSVDRVLITGADSTARAIAELMSGSGANVFACDIREEAVQSIVADNPRIHAVVADVSREDGVEAVVEQARATMGGIDGLVNVVGIAGPTKPLEDVDSSEWQQTINVNLNSVFYMCRAVIPEMKSRRQGSIVNISSASTRTRLPNRSPYIVSKFAIEGLTLNLARELGPFGIRSNAILPGGILNDRFKGILKSIAEKKGLSLDEMESEAKQFISMRTFIEPKEVAELVHFLCSNAARHITGQLLALDGNMEWEE